MTHRLDQSRLEALAQRVRPGGSLVQSFPLEGGVSATTTAIDIALPDGSLERLVARQHGDRTGRSTCNIARVEFALLTLLEQADLPAQRPVFLDEGHEFSNGNLLIVTYVEGSTDFEPADERSVGDQLATYLARLHAIRADSSDLTFLPDLNARIGRWLDSIPSDIHRPSTLASLRTALAPAWPPAPADTPVVLHGDFWPGNFLWRDGRLAAVIDWEDTALGSPLFDVASTRLELLWLFGEDAMHTFTERYFTLTSFSPAELPLWDLCAALDPALHLSTWGKEADVEYDMRAQLARFVDWAAMVMGGEVSRP